VSSALTDSDTQQMVGAIPTFSHLKRFSARTFGSDVVPTVETFEAALAAVKRAHTLEVMRLLSVGSYRALCVDESAAGRERLELLRQTMQALTTTCTLLLRNN